MMSALLSLLVAAQTAFWGWATWRTFRRVRVVGTQSAPPAHRGTIAANWLLVALFAAFTIGSFGALLGYN